MPSLDRKIISDALLAHFDAETIAKGHDYQRQWRVWSVAISPGPANCWTIKSKVHGSRPESYLVELDLKLNGAGLSLDGKCSCPVGEKCKHLAATVQHLMENMHLIVNERPAYPQLTPAPVVTAPPKKTRPPRASQPTPAAEAKLTPMPKADPKVASWIQRLSKLFGGATVPPPPEPPVSTDKLVYLLKPDGVRLKVELVVVHPRLKGGFNIVTYLRASDLLYSGRRRLSWTQEIDVTMVRKLALAQPTFNTDALFVEGADAVEILTGMLATQRCYWRGVGGNPSPLSLGGARPARPVWIEGPEGTQSTSLEITPPATVLLSSPFWYVDETDHVCGPLESGLPEAVTSAWLAAPPLLITDTPSVSAKMGERLAQLGLPLPRIIEFDEISGVVPVPCLRLYSVEVPLRARARYDRYRDDEIEYPEKLSFARLEFDYAGAKVQPKTPGDRLREVREGRLRILRRDLKAEAAAHELLFETPLEMAGEVFWEHHLGQRKNEYTIDTEEDWFEIVQVVLPAFRKAGWRVEIDDSFNFRIAEAEGWYTDAEEGKGNQWFDLELGVMLDGQKVNLLPVLLQFLNDFPEELTPELVEALPADGFIMVPLPDGRKLQFPVARARQTLGVLIELMEARSLSSTGKLRLNKLQATELAGEADWRWLGSAELREMGERLRNFSGIRPVPPPPGLQATLRAYQNEGLSWLQFLREYGLAGILADDMGLGKTVQALAHLIVEKDAGRMDRPSLVIAPTSLMTNWRQEAERFAPSLRVLVLHGPGRKEHFERLSGHDLIVTSYPLLPRDQVILLKQDFHYIILDEAQFIKNPKTTYAQIACQLRARHHLCLTGTPMENHLGELWSLFHFLLPGFLSDEIRFNRYFRRPIEKGKSEDRRKMLARRVAPFILRRRKDQVAKELPAKTEIVQNVELDGAQRDLYESVRLAMHQRVKEEIGKKGMSRAHIIILDALLKLRQICCHPKLLKLPAAQLINQSAKLELLLDMLPPMIDEGRRVLLFSQFTSMLAIIEPALAKLKIPYVLLTGQTQDRATPVARFQKREVPLFLISLKAGGTGLNLTAADTVIHYDPWWNPAVENQATDRAHRIGQDKQVFVYKLMTVGTVEEKIAAMQARKRELVEGLLDEKRAQNLALTAEDLDVLFSPLS